MALDARTFDTLRARVRADVVALDVVMPGTDGIELVGRLAREGSPPSVILLSGYPD